MRDMLSASYTGADFLEKSEQELLNAMLDLDKVAGFARNGRAKLKLDDEFGPTLTLEDAAGVETKTPLLNDGRIPESIHKTLGMLDIRDSTTGTAAAQTQTAV